MHAQHVSTVPSGIHSLGGALLEENQVWRDVGREALTWLGLCWSCPGLRAENQAEALECCREWPPNAAAAATERAESLVILSPFPMGKTCFFCWFLNFGLHSDTQDLLFALASGSLLAGSWDPWIARV